MAGCIRELPNDVIARIAAGEVVQRPASAIKELLENSVDAGATQVTVNVKQGGLKLLQVQDNGSGITKEDLPLLCHRFATSKLRAWTDLQNIASFGFRGEALASISNVAHVSVTTRTADSNCAYVAKYELGDMIGEARASAGNVGTVITAEDLFYNMPVRRSALRNTADEHSRVVAAVSAYAIHYPTVAVCLKHTNNSGQTTVDLRTMGGDSSVKTNLGIVYGQAVASELVPFDLTDSRLAFHASGFITSPNYVGARRFTLLLFINHRLVESQQLKNSLEAGVSSVLPRNVHPFIYLDIRVPPGHIDVNVHPTKAEVRFLYEADIAERLQDLVTSKLQYSDQSRPFKAKTISTPLPPPTVQTQLTFSAKLAAANNAESPSSQSRKRTYDHALVRTDAREQKLDSFLTTTAPVQSSSRNMAATQSNEQSGDVLMNEPSTSTDPTWRAHGLHSVNNLQQAILQPACKRDALQSLSFVGCVDTARILAQRDTQLCMADLRKLSEELFYQIMIFRFANLRSVRLSEPLRVADLIDIALDLPQTAHNPETDGSKQSITEKATELLSSKSPMLAEYFSLEIVDGAFTCLPELLEGYSPNLNALPVYALRLCFGGVNWTEEEQCFRDLARETARFYSVGYDADLAAEVDSAQSGVIEHIVFPAVKSRLMPPSKDYLNQLIKPLVDLHDLYKVFERC